MNEALRAQPVGQLASKLYRRFAAQSSAILLVLWVLGFWPTFRMTGEPGVVAMLVGSCVSLLASWVGTVPMHRARERSALESMSAIMGTIALRLVVILVLALAVALSGFFERVPLLIWVAISHAGLLVADTAFARAHMVAKDERKIE